jgi:transposase
VRYVGIDVHQAMSSVCILDESGKQERAFTVRGPWPKLMEQLRLEGEKGPLAVCYEASNGYGFLHDQFSKFAQSVAVAHPGKLRLIFRSKRKNDRLDAERLAKVLFLGEVPEVYVPGHNVRAHRRLITFRTKEVNTRTCVKNRLRGLLRRNGILPVKSLWSRRGLVWLASLELDSPTALERDLLLDELAQAAVRIKRVEKELNRIAKAHPAIALLRTIPGVGVRTAEAIVAWVDRPERFSRYNTIGAYFGLVPSQDASAGVERMGHITRQGPPVVRRLLIEAAWQAVRRSADFRARFEHHLRKDPARRKIAIVAIAHELVRIMRAMLLSGTPYRASLN